MTALWIVLAALVLLALLPVSVELRYDGEVMVALRLGPVGVTLLPKKARKSGEEKPKKEKKKKPKKEKKPKQEPDAEQPKKKLSVGGTVEAAKPLIRVAVDALKCFRHMLLFRDLTVHVTAGASDAASAAIAYGRAWAAIGVLTPMIDSVFHVRRRDCQAFVDFEDPKMRVLLHAHVTMALWQIVSFAVVYGVRGAAAFVKFQKKRKGGANS